MMDDTSYLVHWIWLGVLLVLLALLSPAAGLVGLALWLWLHWKPKAQWRWIAASLLREAITGYTGVGTLLTRALPVWGESTLLGPTIAGLVQLFRPQRSIKPTPTQQPAHPALPGQPAQTQLSGVARRLTLPSPAVKPDQPQDASSSLAS